MKLGGATDRVVAAVLALLMIASCGSSSPAASPLPLRFVQDIPLPGPATRFDYQDLDPTSQRLVVAHLGADSVVVIDLQHLAVLQTIPGLPSVHGVRVAPELGHIYATVTAQNELAVIDPASYAVTNTIPVGAFPDDVDVDPKAGLVFVSNKNDGTVTVIDARTNSVTYTIAVADEVGNVVADVKTGHAFVAALSPNQLTELDPVAGAVIRRIELENCKGAHGIVIAAEQGLAFVACEDNDRLAVVDLASGHQLASEAVGSGPDVLAYDPSLRRLYVAAESGVVTILEVAPTGARLLGRDHLAAHAHSVAVDPGTHRVYFPLQDIDGHAVLRVMEPPT